MVAQTEEVQFFFSEVMRNSDPYHIPEVDANGVTKPPENIPMNNRLKSAEMLGKSHGMFIDRVDVRQQVSYVELVQDAYSIPDADLDRIKLQYELERAKKTEAKIIEAETKALVFEAALQDEINDLF